jgi:hypothetical protein
MLEKTDITATPSASPSPCTGEAEEDSVASSSALVFDCFDTREQKRAQPNASGREAERVSEIVYLTRKRERATRLIDPVEDSLYLLILAAASGYLLIAFLGV